jgi:hypothetical protein
MTDNTAIGAARTEVPRHGGNGNPLILLPEFAPDPDLAAILRKPYAQRKSAEHKAIKGKYAYYSRASSAGKAIESTKALEQWGRRMVAIGVATREDLRLSVAAHAVDPDGNKSILNDLAEQALEAAKASAAATTGTALHKVTEYDDDGIVVPGIGETATRDLDAYRACKTRYGVTMHRAEQFVVCDELGVAGTFDRAMSVEMVPDVLYVGDVKTGNTAKDRNGNIERDDLGRPVLAYVTSIAVQLAVYAHSALYDPATGARSPLGVHQGAAIVIHLPQGLGSCELYWLDIAAGWEAAYLAKAARDWQGRRDLAVPFTQLEK